MEADDFWDNVSAAQETMKLKKSIEQKIAEYENLKTDIHDIEELIPLVIEMQDEQEAKNLVSTFHEITNSIDALKIKILLSGDYDTNDAIVSIHSGTGGVDAMDWASILYRMYTRWAEKKKYSIKVLDFQNDTEAGIKSATLYIEGENAYGYLKNEAGVHRLVRISPFNTAGKRQTSFAAVEVIPDIEDSDTLEIDTSELRIDTYRSSGAGGQHVNKTDSAIRITHLPTNIVVTCQNERSQHKNKEMAMKILKSKLIQLKELERKENQKALKGEFSQNTWGSQIRSYVFQPYTLVKDHRTNAENGNVSAVLDGDLDYFINEKLKQTSIDETK